MKILPKSFSIFAVALLLCFGFAVESNSAEMLRVRFTINDNWIFFPNDISDAEKETLQDDNWQRINLPHTWNALDTLDDEKGYRRSVGWYRRQLNVNSSLRGKRIFLYFEGANQTADVYINGRFAGKHTGGYTAFAFDVTDYITFDKQNLIAVKVDNTLNKDVPPINGDFNMYGGIYRDVWLIAADSIHIDILDMASSGVWIDTPQVSEKSATVRIRGTVVNKRNDSKQVEIINTVIDAKGRIIAEMKSALHLNSDSKENFEQTSKAIKNPVLWSPENPYLYKVKTTIKTDGKVVDEISNPLGFRWFKFDAEKGFFLNGKHLKLRGTNRHQDYAGFGNAVPDALQVRDLEIIKDAGFNFLRLAHYPQDPSVLEAADRLGLLIWEEIPIVNQITVSNLFNENAKQMLKEMVRQHRNHPSIIIWGYMNEVFLPVPKTEEHISATVKLAQDLEAVCQSEDPSRATAIAFDHGARALYNSSGLGNITQIVGWNLYHGWYYETFADFGKFMDEEHKKFPNRPLIVSEYGVNGDRRLHSMKPRRYDSTIEWQRMFHESYLQQIDARPFLAGSAIWNQFDFGSEFRGETIPHINQKGLFTFDRKPKDIHYFYKAQFSNKPVLHIATRDWQYRSGSSTSVVKNNGAQFVKQKLDVYTNLSQVELFQNGVSLGRKKVGESKSVSFDVPLRDGVNTLLAKGTHNGVAVNDITKIYFTYYPQRLNDPSFAFKELSVNAGSNAQFIDAGNTVWEADKPYETGSWGYLGKDSKEFSSSSNVLNTLEDPLYQTMRKGLTAYRFDVPDGDYEIELRFVETEFREAGKRIFNVSINKELFIARLDLAKEYNIMQPVARRFRLSVKDNQGINIEFNSSVGQSVLSSVRIKRLF